MLLIVERAHALSRILGEVVGLTASRLRVEGCSVFLMGDEGRLVREASYRAEGLPTSPEIETEAERVAVQATVERQIRVAQTTDASLLASPLILRNLPVGALVLQSLGHREFSRDEIETLATISAQLVVIVENARIMEALDRGERPAPLRMRRQPLRESSDAERPLQGLGASPGIAMGVAVYRGSLRRVASDRDASPTDPGVERARVALAIEKTRDDLLRLQGAAAREVDEEHALIFASHLQLLSDPMLLVRVDDEIGRSMSAPRALENTLDDFEARLREVPDAYIQEKVDDIDDLRSRLLNHALDEGKPEHAGARVVLSSRLGPSMVVELKTEGAQAIVTESGGATSHGVLLARALGIPAVTGIADLAFEIQPNDMVIVDGAAGAVIVRPTAATLARYERLREAAEQVRTEHAKYRDVLARTADGVRVTLRANVGVASDLCVARENGAEGVGLFRTEFPFIVRDTFPTEGEQVRIYRKAYEAFPDGPICFRILDLAGDKFVGTGGIAAARHAFHGYRSIRVLFDHPNVLRDQVRALALAAADRDLRIMIPMVTSIGDLRRAKELIGQALAASPALRVDRAPEVGAMIEVPAAVELAFDLAREADFLSIGTNDLMQYTLVVDREDPWMAPLSDPYHPAILRMIARVVSAGVAAGKPVGVCGEIAALPDVAMAMLALGVDSLSVVPTAIPGLKQAFAHANLEPMRRAMGSILALSDGPSIAAALRECS